jgi:hypothetical protein
MIEHIPPAASDPTLCNSILLKATKCPDCLQADSGNSSANYLSKPAVPIMNQKLLTIIANELQQIALRVSHICQE